MHQKKFYEVCKSKQINSYNGYSIVGWDNSGNNLRIIIYKWITNNFNLG